MYCKQGLLVMTDRQTGARLKEPEKVDEAWLYTKLTTDGYGKPTGPVMVEAKGKDFLLHIHNPVTSFELSGITITGTADVWGLFPLPKTPESRMTKYLVGVEIYIPVTK